MNDRVLGSKLLQFFLKLDKERRGDRLYTELRVVNNGLSIIQAFSMGFAQLAFNQAPTLWQGVLRGGGDFGQNQRVRREANDVTRGCYIDGQVIAITLDFAMSVDFK